jgi:hypothetical protein
MIYLLVSLRFAQLCQNHDGRAWFLKLRSGRRGDIVSNECLKKSHQPYPGSFACIWLLYAFYDRELQTAKKKQEIKTELQFRAEQARDTLPLWIGQVNPAKVQNRIAFFFASDDMTTRSLDRSYAPLRQIAPGHLTPASDLWLRSNRPLEFGPA